MSRYCWRLTSSVIDLLSVERKISGMTIDTASESEA